MNTTFLKSYVRALSGNQESAQAVAFSDLLEQSAQGYLYGFAWEDLLKTQNKVIDHLESITDISELTLEKIFSPYRDESIQEIKSAYKFGFQTAAEMMEKTIDFLSRFEEREKLPETLGQ